MVKSASSSRAPRILVIDDDATILELIKAVLIEDGYSVDAVLSGNAALDATEDTPSLVVLDMYLPGLSGAPLAEALRATYGANLPILVTSATNVDDEAQSLGAYAYLAKPFDLEDLLAAVHRGIGPTAAG